MTLEKGDYFVVTRGFEYHPCGLYGFSIFGTPEDRKDEKPNYDRSHEGNVYQAIAVAGPVVAAKLVHSNRSLNTEFRERIGRVESLNTAELEVMTVGGDFVSALLTQEARP